MRRKISLSRKKVFNYLEAIVGLVLLVFLAFALNALVAGRASQTAGPPQLPTPHLPSATPTVAISQTDPTAGWKVYTRVAHRYSIKYPTDWSLQEVPNIAFKSSGYEITPNGIVVAGGMIVIGVSDYPSNEPLSEIYSNEGPTDFTIVKRKEITISNLPALWYVAEAPGSTAGTITGAIVATGNRLYGIAAYYSNNDKDKIVEVFELMLKSMKFTTK